MTGNMPEQARNRLVRFSKMMPWRIVIVYVAVAGLWITFSDLAVEALLIEPRLITRVQTLKGWGFVLVTGLLLFILIHRNLGVISKLEKQTQDAAIEQNERVRKAYSDVLDAVTGGRLWLSTEAEISDALGPEQAPTFSVRSIDDVSRARVFVRSVLSEKFPALPDQDDFLVAICEAVTNCYKHAGGGEVSVYVNDRIVQVAIRDSGPGIDSLILPKAMLKSGFSTGNSLGLGFTFMLEFSSRVVLSTQPGSTWVILEKALDPEDEVASTGQAV